MCKLNVKTIQASNKKYIHILRMIYLIYLNSIKTVGEISFA